MSLADRSLANGFANAVEDLGKVGSRTRRYLDGLIGPYPEAKDTYVARSPINHTDQLSAPMIVLQGGEDKIVPPNQAEMIVDALSAKGLPHAYVLFPSEGHGFRDGDNVVTALESEYSFFAQIFDFDPADEIPQVEIHR